MEKWRLIRRRNRGGPQYYLDNRAQTLVWTSPTSKSFDILAIFHMLEEVGFPLRFMNKIKRVNFQRLRDRAFGEYYDGELWIDTRRKHRLSTLIDTFVHEVAHNIDEEYDFSNHLTEERKQKGTRIHKIAGQSDEEYFARGFERFYSMNPNKKAALKKRNPKLYKRIAAIHRKFKSRAKK
jgi:hypothetical protein